MVGIGFCGRCDIRIFRDEKYTQISNCLICSDCFDEIMEEKRREDEKE